MKPEIVSELQSNRLRIHKKPLLRESGKIIFQFLLTAIFIGIGIWFIRNQHAEIYDVKKTLVTSDIWWVLLGIVFTALFVLLQGLMYVFSFASLGQKISIYDSVILYLKRNLISIFLPMGGVASLAFFTGDIEKRGISKSQIHFASSIYGFVSILSVIFVAVPAFIYALFKGSLGKADSIGLILMIVIISIAFMLYKSLTNKGFIYKQLLRLNPEIEVFIDDLQTNKIDRKRFIFTFLLSFMVELTGILHLYISMKAIHIEPSIYAAIMAYLIAIIFLLISPFLRGLGAIEVSTAFLLTRFGFSETHGVAITFLFRFFQFWLPLLLGIFSFMIKLNKILLRVVPATLIFLLGVINIVSIAFPNIPEKLLVVRNYMLFDTIDASNFFVLTSGVFLLITAAFMIRGFRISWWFGLVLTLFSFIGHITRSIDYQDAAAAFIVFVILIFTRKHYYIRTNPKSRIFGIQVSSIGFLFLLIYGVTGFIFLDRNHIKMEISWFQAFEYTLQNIFLIGSDLGEIDLLAYNFILTIKLFSLICFGVLIFSMIRPYVFEKNNTEDEHKTVKRLICEYGKSPLDYFKSYPDKLIFLSNDRQSFLSYRISGNFAVVLENPVSSGDNKTMECLNEFEEYCNEHGLRSLYYRIPENSVSVYKKLGLNALFIGREATIDLNKMDWNGLRNETILKQYGFKFSVHIPPVTDDVLHKIKSVSDEWLNYLNRKEIVFSQGMFMKDELKKQRIFTIENSNNEIVAFLNLLPDYFNREAAYDLLRKTKDSPSEVLDYLLIETLSYLKSIGYKTVNMGFAPMSGIDDPHSFPEKSMRFAYEKMKAFSHFKGIHEFKNKFNPVWNNCYLIYCHDYDLVRVPSALSKVTRL